MRIEIAVPDGTPNKEKGDLLEQLARDFLESQNYSVKEQIRITGSELDLLADHMVSKRRVYVECKAHRDALSANVITNLEGTRSIKKYHEAWLISTGPFGKDAKGLQTEWESQSADLSQSLSFYTPERIIQALKAASVIIPPPQQQLSDYTQSRAEHGDWILLITPRGRFWCATILEAGIPTSVYTFSALDSAPISDIRILNSLSETDTTLSSLNFEPLTHNLQIRTEQEPNSDPHSDPVVKVQYGESIDDYRPAPPQFFVGRHTEEKYLIRRLTEINDKPETTRIYAITGDSGMGKSSLIVKLAARTRNLYYRNKVFCLPVDVRAATKPSYILSALLACFREASAAGFGTADPEQIRITNPTDPLESESVQHFLDSLLDRGQVVCLVLDQFEELYSKPELFPIFEMTQRLALSVSASRSNFALCVAWKSDSTVQQDHPAYHLWHRLSDIRKEIQLKPFSQGDSTKAISLFEKEFSTTLSPGLKRQLVEQSRGLPWLIKKLSIHIFSQISSGTSVSELKDKDLDVETLFKNDLQQLTPGQTSCLKYVAQNAPADWIETINIYGVDVVRSLQDRRLIVRSGDRLNIYWDIFKEYLLTGKVPYIPVGYLPSSPSVAKMLQVAELLDHDSHTEYSTIASSCSVSIKTVGNVIRDLVMFGVAESSSSQARLSTSVASNRPEDILLQVRQALSRHGLTIQLNKLKSGSPLPYGRLVQQLRRINPAASHSAKTWRMYAERMAFWLEAAGYLERRGQKWIRRDTGTVDPHSYYRAQISKSFGDVFLPDASIHKVVEAATHLQENQLCNYKDAQRLRLTSAFRILKRLGLATSRNGSYHAQPSLLANEPPHITVWEAANANESLNQVIEHVSEHPTTTGFEVGHILAQQYHRSWSRSTKSSIGQGLLRWVRWLKAGRQNDTTTPPRPKSSTLRKRVSPVYFSKISARQASDGLWWLAQHEPVAASQVSGSKFYNPLLILGRLGLVQSDEDNKKRCTFEASTVDDINSVITKAFYQLEIARDLLEFISQNPAVTGPTIGDFVADKYHLKWSRKTRNTLGTNIKSWLRVFRPSDELPLFK